MIVVVSAVAFSWFGLDLGKPKSLSRWDISCFVKAMNFSQHLPSIGLLLAATTLEVSGDAVVRMAIYNYTGFGRLGLMLAGAVLLLGYGFSLNLAPMEFGQVVGLYITTLFVVWQVINFIAFRATPTLPILVGGALIILGGLIITFWKAQPWPSV